ncbi:unnamed protein product [Cochlearia groenlandica]
MLHRGISCLTGLFPCYLLSNWLNSDKSVLDPSEAGHSLFPVNSGVLLKFLLLLAISTCLLGEDSLIWLTLVVAHSKSRQSSSQDPHQSWLASLSNSTFPQQPV